VTIIGTKATFDELLVAYDNGCERFYGVDPDFAENVYRSLMSVSTDEHDGGSAARTMRFFTAHFGNRTWSKDYASIEDAVESEYDELGRKEIEGDDFVIVLDDYEFGCMKIMEVVDKLRPRRTLVFYLPEIGESPSLISGHENETRVESESDRQEAHLKENYQP